MPGIEVTSKTRRSPVLSGSDLPCLKDVATINVTLGCVHRCVYCYAQGYSNYPGHRQVVVYENLAEKVKAELPRKRKKSHRAYFSPSCDAFQPVEAVLDTTYNVMRVLLENNVQVAFLTKGTVPERFLELFRSRPRLVHAQIGLTTLDADIAEALEPGAATPWQRIANIRHLSGLGIPVGLRLDPLFPLITDTDENLSALFAEASAAGAAHVAVAYLFLRGALRESVLSAAPLKGGLADRLTDLFSRGVSLPLHGEGHRVQALPADYRKGGYERISRLATGFGLKAHVCGCKNGDITSEMCQISGIETAGADTQLPLPFSHS